MFEEWENNGGLQINTDQNSQASQELPQDIAIDFGDSSDSLLERLAYIFLFVCLWALMVFPVLYDLVVSVTHLVVTFTPKPNRQDHYKSETAHYEYFMEHRYDPELRKNELVLTDWDAWTVWSVL
jgi:hypothetical protein